MHTYACLFIDDILCQLRCSGFLFCKVGRPAALAVGTSLLVLQVVMSFEIPNCVVNLKPNNETVKVSDEVLMVSSRF